MKLEEFKDLIINLPVRFQSSQTKRITWSKKAEKEIDWLPELNNKLFKTTDPNDPNATLNINRQNIFATEVLRDLILKTIYWGYPSGMRNNYHIDILKSNIEVILKDSRRKNYKSNEFKNLTVDLKKIKGIGLSTYSKLLYFMEIKIEECPCLIFDQKVINAINFYDNYSELPPIKENNKEKIYLDYLKVTYNLAASWEIHGENIEEFLFIFGNNLHSENENHLS